jgi:hypothetical protein
MYDPNGARTALRRSLFWRYVILAILQLTVGGVFLYLWYSFRPYGQGYLVAAIANFVIALLYPLRYYATVSIVDNSSVSGPSSKSPRRQDPVS